MVFRVEVHVEGALGKCEGFAVEGCVGGGGCGGVGLGLGGVGQEGGYVVDGKGCYFDDDDDDDDYEGGPQEAVPQHGNRKSALSNG